MARKKSSKSRKKTKKTATKKGRKLFEFRVKDTIYAVITNVNTLADVKKIVKVVKKIDPDFLPWNIEYDLVDCKCVMIPIGEEFYEYDPKNDEYEIKKQYYLSMNKLRKALKKAKII